MEQVGCENPLPLIHTKFADKSIAGTGERANEVDGGRHFKSSSYEGTRGQLAVPSDVDSRFTCRR